jgi:hypothetical protein
MLAIVSPLLFLRSNKIKTIALINQTSIEYDEVIAQCRNIFQKKNHDYGQSWRIMRISSIIDQIFIKATRIRTIEENGKQKINEGVESEWMGIINYCVMGLIQCGIGQNETTIDNKNLSISIDELSQDVSALMKQYDQIVSETKALMEQKNHDYGEIWRNMLVSTFTDMLLMRVNRMHQILENKGNTLASEGVESNLMDMINYSVFALIRLK